VKTPVGRIFVFTATLRAKRKTGHGSVISVVGNPANDGQARTAVSAIYKRVTKATVGGIEKLPDAFWASGGVRGNENIRSAAVVAGDNKIDLLPYLDFDLEKAKRDARALNAKLKILEMSCKTEAGLEDWINWLTQHIDAFQKK